MGNLIELPLPEVMDPEIRYRIQLPEGFDFFLLKSRSATNKDGTSWIEDYDKPEHIVQRYSGESLCGEKKLCSREHEYLWGSISDVERERPRDARSDACKKCLQQYPKVVSKLQKEVLILFY